MGRKYQRSRRRFLTSKWCCRFSANKPLSSFLHARWFAHTICILLVLCVLMACGNGDDPTGNQPTKTETNLVEDVVFVIGNLTDQTGVSASAMHMVNTALEDMVMYFNDESLIPGVQLKIENYDTQYDATVAISGYQRLRSKGAQVIWSTVPTIMPELRPIADQDRFPVITATAGINLLDPPGYVFSVGIVPEQATYTLLKWIAENHWDYETKGPAKIGGAAWADDISDTIFKAMKDYVDTHPDQYEWVGTYLSDFSIDWSDEIEALKDCDYLYPPIPMDMFVAEYRAAGYTGTFFGMDPHVGFMEMIDKGDYWDEIDGMLFIRGSRWWTEDGKLIDLTKELLYSNHGVKAEDIMRSGVGYLSSAQDYQLCQIIKLAAGNVGPQNLDHNAIYDAALHYSESVDGVDRYEFDETKRCSTNYYIMYEVNGDKSNLYRADPDWIPVVVEP